MQPLRTAAGWVMRICVLLYIGAAESSAFLSAATLSLNLGGTRMKRYSPGGTTAPGHYKGGALCPANTSDITLCACRARSHCMQLSLVCWHADKNRWLLFSESPLFAGVLFLNGVLMGLTTDNMYPEEGVG